MKREILRLEDICTSENSVNIVRDADFHIFEGETVGLVGMTYAGKSTLMGAVTGEHPCNSGKIWICEKQKKIEAIETARKEGIFLIKDHSSLIDAFTIRDMMHLNFAFAEKKTRYREYLKKCKNTLKLLDIQGSEETLIGNLDFHKRVLLEIAQALVCNVRVIVLDNVISLLSDSARIKFVGLFKKLKLYGISIVLIESQTDLIKEYLDRLCIMRRGRVVAELLPEEIQEKLVLSLSEGENYVPGLLKSLYDVDEINGKDILEFSHVMTEDHVIKDLNFQLRQGEILGIWNKNRHSGQAIMDILEGRLKLAKGNIRCNGYNCNSTREGWIYPYGIYSIPETDRLCSNMTIGENIGLSALDKNAYMGLIMKDGELRYLIQNLCEEYLGQKEFLLFPDQMVPDSQLARKKISLCRALAAGAEIIVYNNPFLHMDIKEREVLIGDLVRTQKKGISQVLISSQIEMLYPLCNRIVQVDEGKNRQELQNKNRI